MVLSLAINVIIKGGSVKSDSPQLKEQIEKASKPTASPVAAPSMLPGSATPQAGDTSKK